MNHAESNILWERISKYSNTMTRMMQPNFSTTSSNRYSKNSTNPPTSNSKKSIITTREVEWSTKRSSTTKKPVKNPSSRIPSLADTKSYSPPQILDASIPTQVLRNSTFTFCNYHKQKEIEWICNNVCLYSTMLMFLEAIMFHTVTVAKRRCSIIKLCRSMKQTRYLQLISSAFLITARMKPLFQPLNI